MKRLTRRLDRRGWMYVSGGFLGAVLITAAAAWACTPVNGAQTVIVSPNSTNSLANIGVSITSYTRVTSGAGLPRTDTNSGALLNYQFKLHALGVTSGGGVCDHQPAQDVGAFAENGTIGSPTDQKTRLVKWPASIYDHVDNYSLDPTEPHSSVCWSADPPGSGGDHGSSRELFYLL